MKRMILSILHAILLFSSLAVFSALLNISLSVGASQQETSRDLFGVGEPLTYRNAWNGESLNISKAFEIMEFLSISSLREWTWRQMLFNDSGLGWNAGNVSALNNVIMEARSRNITILGMIQDFPSWMTDIKNDPQAIPYRNLTNGSPYKRFLEKHNESCVNLAQTFPDITMWEIGNEYNLDEFLHPEGYNQSDPYSSQPFDSSMKANIMTDLLYYGSSGIHAGNPNAVTVMGGLGPSENTSEGLKYIEDFLDAIYKNIESGDWPSTNTTDFFQVACWHPYLLTQKPNQTNWVEPNNAIHNVMIAHGDADKPVVFSEFGYSDNSTGLTEAQVAEYVNETFSLARTSFQPWLKTVYWFRLIDPDPQFDKLPPEQYGFGLVKSPANNYDKKPAAFTYAEIVPEFPSIIVILLDLTFATMIAIATRKLLPRSRRLNGLNFHDKV